MTHGTLNIYIYDTQHLKHNGFTEIAAFLVIFATFQQRLALLGKSELSKS